jgi:8-oxo-dGTP diphosphatase
MSEKEVAAGGIVFDREQNGEVLVLVVHRPRYDDWSFPKGKTNPKETVQDAAIREVKEETGLECRIVGDLGTTAYGYRRKSGSTREKIVYYFLMEPVGGSIETDGDEVDSALWIESGKAEGLMSYEADREKLQSGLELIDRIRPA